MAGSAWAASSARAMLGYGSDRHRIERVGVISELDAKPDGSHVTAGAKAGYLLPVWKMRAGPIVALDYARAKVDGYTEAGDAALTLNVDNQTLKGTTGQLGIEGRMSFIPGVRSYATLAAERELSGNSRVIRFSQTSAPIDRQPVGNRAGRQNLRPVHQRDEREPVGGRHDQHHDQPHVQTRGRPGDGPADRVQDRILEAAG